MSNDDRPKRWASLGSVAPAMLDDVPAFAAFLKAGEVQSVESARKDLGARVELDLLSRQILFSRFEHDRRHDKLGMPHICTDHCVSLPSTRSRATLVGVRDEYAIRWPS